MTTLLAILAITIPAPAAEPASNQSQRADAIVEQQGGSCYERCLGNNPGKANVRSRRCR